MSRSSEAIDWSPLGGLIRTASSGPGRGAACQREAHIMSAEPEPPTNQLQGGRLTFKPCKTASLAAPFLCAATLSSRSKMMQSASDCWLFLIIFSLLPGTYSIERRGAAAEEPFSSSCSSRDDFDDGFEEEGDAEEAEEDDADDEFGDEAEMPLPFAFDFDADAEGGAALDPSVCCLRIKKLGVALRTSGSLEEK
jgi:hypothetical protein